MRLRSRSGSDRIGALSHRSGPTLMTGRSRFCAQLIALTLGAGIAFSAACAGFPRMYKAQTGRDALDAAARSGKPIMIYFSQPDCVWCDRVEHVLRTAESRFDVVDHYHFVNINIRQSDDAAARALKNMFRVRGTPAFAFLSPRGQPICMLYGNIADDEELAEIDRTVQALFRGSKATLTARGFASCRGKVSPNESLVTEIQ